MVKNLLSSSPSVLPEILRNMFLNEECYRNEVESLRQRVDEQAKENHNLLSQVQTLEIAKADADSSLKALSCKYKALKLQVNEIVTNNSDLCDKCDELEEANSHLSKELQDSKNTLSKFAGSENSLKLMLGSSQRSVHKSGIGYNPNFPKKNQTTFVKSIKRHSPTCFYCGKIGHVKFTCPFRRIEPHILRNTYPYALKGQVRQIWVKKGVRPPNMVDPEYESKFCTWSNSQLRQ
jgi:cell division protein FtsL